MIIESSSALYRALREVAAEIPDATAIVGFDSVTTSYRQLLETTDAVAEILRETVESGLVVGLANDDPVTFLAGYFAVAGLGGVAVLLDGAATPEETARRIEKFDLNIVVRDGTAGRGSVTVATFGEVGAAEYSPTDFVVHCTSGSTGVPKGIVMSEAAVMARVRSWSEQAGLAPGDVVLCALPLWHGHGIDVLTLPSLLSGATVVFARGALLTARGLARMIDAHSVTVISGLPVMYQMLVAADGVDGSMLGSLRLALTGSAPITADTQLQFRERFGMSLRQGYGLGEIGIITYDADDAGDGTIGFPLPDIEWRVEDVEQQDGTQVSELLVRGPSLASGYYRDPEATATMFSGGWLRTQDLVVLGADGWYLRGRKSTFINVTGNKVAPLEVEAALSECQGVVDCAVVGVPESDGGEQVAALVVAEPGCTAETIRRQLGSRLRPHQLPQLYSFTTAIPRTPVGKTDYDAAARLVRGTATFDPDGLGYADLARSDAWVERPALEWSGRALTYGQLETAVTAVTARLGTLGAARSSVLIMGPLCPAYVIGLLAAWRAGAVPVPVDAGLTAEQYAWLEQITCPAVVISNDATPARQLQRARTDIAELVLDAASGATVVESFAETRARRVIFGNSDAGYVILTSGSTGEPKAIVGSRRGLGRFLTWFRGEFALDSTDRCAAVTRVNFDPSLRELLGVLGVGGTLSLPPVDVQLDLTAYIDHLLESCPTTLFLVPSVATRLAREARLTAGCLDGVRLIFFAGEVLGRRVLEQWSALAPNAEIVNLYGQTEATLAQVYRRKAQDIGAGDTAAVPVGWPRPGIAVTVEDPDDAGIGAVLIDADAPALGTLAVRSADESGGHRIEPLPTPLRTGDLGYWCGEGELAIVGRAGDDLKFGGRRVSFHGLVDAVEALPQVRQCAVVDRDGPHVFVATELSGEPGGEFLRDEVTRIGAQLSLPGFRVHLRPAFPLSRSGKVDRRALLTSIDGPDPAVTDAGDSELADVEDLLRGLLGPGAGITGFADSGITSLDMVDVVAAVRRRYGIHLTVHDCFGLRDLPSLAREIEKRRSGAEVTTDRVTVADADGTTGDVYPLSTRQLAYLWVCMADGNANWCNLSREIQLPLPCSVESVGEAVGRLLDRHDALGLALTADWRQQRYTEPARLPVTVGLVDVAARTDSAEFRDTVHNARATLVAELIDPTAPPPLRSVLIRGTNGCSVILVAHHLFVDGLAMDTLADELRAFSTAREPGAATTSPGSYREYCLATARTAQPEAAEYWRTLLDGVRQLRLPETGAADAAAGELMSLPIGLVCTRIVHRVAAELGVSAFTVVLAAFDRAVATTFGFARLPIVVASQNRGTLDAGAVGNFTTTLIVRGPGEPALRDNISVIARQLADGAEHSDWEFDQRVTDLGLTETDCFPISTVLFNQHPMPRNLRARELGSWQPRALGRKLRYQLQGELQMSGPEMVMTYYYRTGIAGAGEISRVHRSLLREIRSGQADCDD
ncbi:AMP-binding protein [Nocardia sp. NPDC056064]|uniref:AMP-binding protein n=1 Tax=Nocardia sp. NPDC056064 TaxID=3345701 RepID=UPI0035E075E7